MNTFLANDLVIQEDNCNLSCQYCLTGQSNFKKEHSELLIFQPPRPSSYSPETALGRRLDELIITTGQALNLPIIKVTGGEIFLVRGMMSFLRHVSTHFATIVVQTNGVLLDKQKAAEIKSWGNACLQISIDATSFAGNSYRSPSPELHDKILKKIFDLLDVGIPTEIYSVLNDRSLPCLEETLNAFLPYADHVVVHPFPVRGPDHNSFAPKPEQVGVLRRIMDHFEDYGSILPPRAYFGRLLRFFTEGERTFRCHLPRFAFTTFDDGWLTSCPNIWFNKIGNVFDEDAQSVTDRISLTPFHQLLLAPKPRIEACKGCFTPWDMLSMYVDKEISLDELCRTPMYSASASRLRIEEITNAYWETRKC